jgi:hypothetical protein
VRLPKCYVVEQVRGRTSVARSFNPFTTETKLAKARAIAFSGSGRAVRIEIIENISSRVFEVAKDGKIRVR